MKIFGEGFKKFISAIMCLTMVMSFAPAGLMQIALADTNSGLLMEVFEMPAGTALDISGFNFNKKTGELIMPELKESNTKNAFRNIFSTYNNTGGSDIQNSTARFTGKLSVPSTDEYTFHCIGDDGFRVWIDGNLVIDFWTKQWEKEQSSTSIVLVEGLHDIKIEYLQGHGGAWLELRWSTDIMAKVAIPASAYYQPDKDDLGLTAQYYSVDPSNHISSYRFINKLSDDEVMSSLDGSDLKPVISALNDGSSDYITAIFHGYIAPKLSGSYTLSLEGDDAYRMWIENELVVDSWNLNSTGIKTSRSFDFVAGKVYKVKITYAQAIDNANLKLSWSLNGATSVVIPEESLNQATVKDIGDAFVHGLLAEVYKGTYLEEKTGEKIVSEISSALSMGGLLREFNDSTEYGSVRFSGKIESDETKEYTFHMIGDDGFRLKINGEMVIDFFVLEWEKPKVGKVTLNEGKNDIVIEYRQGHGGAWLDLQWEAEGVNKQVVPQNKLYPENTAKGIIAEYYTNTTAVNIENYKFETKTGEGISDKLDFDNETLSKWLMLTNETTEKATIKWSAQLQPEATVEYIITMQADDGYRVYLDGEKIIDNWKITNATTEISSQSIFMDQNKKYDLVVEYLQSTGDAQAKLYWQQEGENKVVIPKSALYISDRVLYDNVIAKNELALLLMEGESLNDKTEVGTEIGQTTKEAKQRFEATLTVTKNIWSNSQIGHSDAAITLKHEIEAFKFCIILSNEAQELTEFNNALYAGQDPFISYKDGYYYLVSTSTDPYHNRMYMSKSETLIDQGEKVQIYDFRGSHSRIFAPELFYIGDKWYIYYCADVGLEEYAWRHQACVLESVTDDPQGEWIDRGVIYTGYNEQQNYKSGANDFTVFEYDGELYASWGPMHEAQLPNGEHYGVAIMKMDSPIKISEDRVFLPSFGGEGPRVLQNDGKVFVTVSMGDFKSSGYHLGVYTYDPDKDNGNGLLDKENWIFTDEVFYGNRFVYGPARASFVKSTDGTEDWMIFHSKVYPANGNAWRQVSINKFDWNNDGSPNFGTPKSPYGFEALPSGDKGIGLVYQAETAEKIGNSIASFDSKGFQGNGFVSVPKETGAGVEFEVEVPESGDYLVRIRYANGAEGKGEWTSGYPDGIPERGKMSLLVNKSNVATTELDRTETDWQHWMYATNRITLIEGTNTVTYLMQAENIDKIYVDYIAVQKAHEKPEPIEMRDFATLNALVVEARKIQESDVYDEHLWKILKDAIEFAGKVNAQSELLAITGKWRALEVAMQDALNSKEPVEIVEFTNPIVPAAAADPWVIFKDGFYYYCRSINDTSITIAKAQRLQDIGKVRAKTVFIAPQNTEYSKELWAPELHFLDGKWYIYVAADNGVNANHRMFVLESVTDDPQGEYIFKGKITDSTDRWAIDGTVLEHEGSMYFIWSGWEGIANVKQNTYIAKMSNPWTISGERVLISSPTEEWEKRGSNGTTLPYINEGAQILKKDGKLFIIYSASGSWSDDYCLGMLTFTGKDVLDPNSWTKSDGPVFEKNPNANAFGTGHASFTVSPDGKEYWIVYHAFQNSNGGWGNRSVRAQKFTWNEDGTPDFGKPVNFGELVLQPTGTKMDKVTAAKINKETVDVFIGKTKSLSVEIEPIYVTTEIDWSSLDTQIASVDKNGVIIGNAIGTTTIKFVIDGDIHGECVVTVKEIPVPEIPSNYNVDHFEKTELDSSWTIINPIKESWRLLAEESILRIKSLGGDMHQTQNNAKNIFLKTAPNGDFEFMTKVDTAVVANYQQAGLIVWQDTDNFIRLGRVHNSNEGGEHIEFAKETLGNYQGIDKSNSELYPKGKTVYLKITKAGNLYTPYFWDITSVAWKQAADSITSNMENIKIGLYALATGDGLSMDADFDYFAVSSNVSTGIILDKTAVEIEINHTETLTATVIPNNASNKDVTWKSLDEDIAKVVNGVVTAVGLGETTITATNATNQTASCIVNTFTSINSLYSQYEIRLITLPEETLYNPKISIINNAEVDETITFIVAGYDARGRMVSKDINTQKIIAGGRKDLQASIAKADNIVVYKYFIWNNTFEPLTNANSFDN